MIHLRGDAHRLYLKLRRHSDRNNDVHQLQEMKEIDHIQAYYDQLDDNMLYKIRYRMMKEKGGAGIIPIFVYSFPWLVFIFSDRLQTWLFDYGDYLWLVFVLVYVTAIVLSVVVHYREKAWASVHLEIITDILRSREQKK